MWQICELLLLDSPLIAFSASVYQNYRVFNCISPPIICIANFAANLKDTILHANWISLGLFKSHNKCIKRNHLFGITLFWFHLPLSLFLCLSAHPARSVCVSQALLNIRKVFTMPAWKHSTACPSPRCSTNSFSAYMGASRQRFSHSTTSRR